MPRSLFALNVALVAVALLLLAYVVRQITTPVGQTAARARPSAASGAAPAPVTPPPSSPAATYTLVANRNLFSPTRSEAPPATPAASVPAPAGPVASRPQLHGVVLLGNVPIAYMEDPATKRVAGYRLGDFIAGGTVHAINVDHVVVARPEGQINIKLRDASRPRPPAPAPAPGVPPTPGAIPPGAVQPFAPTPGAPAPGVVSAPQPTPTPGQPVPSPQTGAPPAFLPPGFQAPADPSARPFRPLPPTIQRRLPAPPSSNAPTE